jgi:hypothetical protein
VRDAEVLLASEQWPGAYHMAGYALECALKSCILKHIDDTGIIFKDKEYLDKLPKKLWTHDLEQLMDLANLRVEFDQACGANPQLGAHWGIAKDWVEISRYERKSKDEASALYKAITNNPDGVLPWIQPRW